jgi:hypothetical protein
MNTQPAPSSSAQNQSAAANATANARHPAPAPTPRHQAERQSLSDRFAAKLERDDNANGAQREEEGQRRENAALPGLFKGEDDAGEGGAQPDLGQREALLRLTAAANLTGTAPPMAAAFDTALLSQIAAQISDGVHGAASAEASIEFPAGSLAQSAHIRRDADGSIAIRIAGLDPRLSAMQNGRVQADLRSALALRRLQVSSLTLERGRDDQEAALSRLTSRPISRVV